MTTLDGFETKTFSALGKTKPVYWQGSGPGVVIIHEIPGITPSVAAFGRRVAEAGFTAVLPHLFGTPNKPETAGYVYGQLARACISREFYVLAQKQSSPITDWLRALCRDVHTQCGGAGVGALGMCLTGGFALSLMVDESVMAPVLSQPSLPFPVSDAHRAALSLSDTDLARVKERTAAGCTLLGLRFTGDATSPPERFETLRRELGEGFEGIEIDSSEGNPFGIPTSAHSVLTRGLVDEAGHPTKAALDRVLGFFEERLRG